MRATRKFFLQRAIKRCLKKAAPNQFKLDSNNDYYTAVIETECLAEGMLIGSIEGDRIAGRAWNGEQFNDECVLRLDGLDTFNLKVTRFYGYHQVDYAGLRSFWVGEIFRYPFWLWLRESYNQKFFNVTTRFRHDRIDVLKALVDLQLTESAKKDALFYCPKHKSITQLFSEVYGRRTFSHPSYASESALFRLIVESLVETGEIDQNKDGFKLNPRSLSTIAEYEQAERRHKDSVIHNRSILVLTFVLATAAIVEVIRLLP